MAIKKLQNDYTTPEQSKRLLELGVPADSANYAYMCYEIGDMCRVFINHPYTIYSENVKRLLGRKTLPCWSVGRLIEIFTTCAEYYTGDNSLVFNRESVSLGNINCLISVIELAVKDKCINFSKLEE